MLIEGLANSGVPEGQGLAKELARRWLDSNLLGWARTGQMHEKYDATAPGERGGGGEYTPQIGFGWTNGVVLWLLSCYAETDVVRGLADEADEGHGVSTLAVVLATLLSIALGGCAGLAVAKHRQKIRRMLWRGEARLNAREPSRGIPLEVVNVR